MWREIQDNRVLLRDIINHNFPGKGKSTAQQKCLSSFVQKRVYITDVLFLFFFSHYIPTAGNMYDKPHVMHIFKPYKITMLVKFNSYNW